MSAEQICQEITQDTDKLYRDTVIPALEALADEKDDPNLGPSGYEVIYGPPIVNAPAFFIGFQPGGGVDHGEWAQLAERNPVWPAQTSYAIQEWKLARVMRGIYGADFLHTCTGSNRQFFRASSDKTYEMWPRDLRDKTAEFSRAQLSKLIQALAPRKIVFIGKRAMPSLVEDATTTLSGANGRFLLGKGTFQGISAIGSIHLTGARVSAEDRTLIGDHLRAFLGC